MSITSDTGPWALVPEWVLDSPISDRAIRLYAVLGRYADDAGACHPSRRTLAARLNCSESSLDRALRELSENNAVVVTHRKTDEGDWTSNEYRVIRALTVKVGGVTGEPTGGVTGDEQTRVNLNERTNPPNPPPVGGISEESEELKDLRKSEANLQMRARGTNARARGTNPRGAPPPDPSDETRFAHEAMMEEQRKSMLMAAAPTGRTKAEQLERLRALRLERRQETEAG
jgi:hypothetical protein